MCFGGNEMIKESLKKDLICGMIVVFIGLSVMPLSARVLSEPPTSRIGSGVSAQQSRASVPDTPIQAVNQINHFFF